MKKISKIISKLFLVLLLSFSTVSVANAASGGTTVSVTTTDDNSLTRTLCNVMKIVTGTAGKTFAAFAIISAGVGFFTGKLQWGLLIALCLGIAAIFGAPKIVATITGTSTLDCTVAGSNDRVQTIQ